MSRAITLRHRFEATLFAVVETCARWLPRRFLLALGALVGLLGYVFDRRHRRIARSNLQLAFGSSLTAAETDAIVRRCWKHFGRITFDTFHFPRMHPDGQDPVIHYEGLEHIRSAYERGKGVLLFSGHFGHWELTAMLQGHLGLPLALVARPLDNPLLETRLAAMRESSGNRVIYKRNAVRVILRVLKNKGGVAIMIDQDARCDGVFVPFFGRLASTTPTLAMIALRTDATIIPTFSLPQSDGSYRVVYEPAVTFERSNDRNRDVVDLTARCTALLESWIRRHPDYWLWMHRRFKTRPPSETARLQDS